MHWVIASSQRKPFSETSQKYMTFYTNEWWHPILVYITYRTHIPFLRSLRETTSTKESVKGKFVQPTGQFLYWFFPTSTIFPIFWTGCLTQNYRHLIQKVFRSTLNLWSPIFPWKSLFQLRQKQCEILSESVGEIGDIIPLSLWLPSRCCKYRRNWEGLLSQVQSWAHQDKIYFIPPRLMLDNEMFY